MRRYKVRRSAEVTRDLDLIEDYLVKGYQDFGDDLENATERAADRVGEALAYMPTFAAYPHAYPHWGTEHKKIRPGIRTVTNKSFVFYFEIDELSSEVRILATFFGGVVHGRQILERFRH